MHRAVLDIDQCIGCGLCVSTCPTESLTLVRKPESDQASVPGNMIEAYVKLGRERGKLSSFSLVQMQMKSKLDRFLASK
ncbi:MAG: 4Fe-4S binding protein [Deltaproteobacteria bacterium]|nr:4Fe-4S binding protein [Deltaproteobacteria bacterium]